MSAPGQIVNVPLSVPNDQTVFDVLAEMERQLDKWGEQNHPDGTGEILDRWWADFARGRCEDAAAKGSVTWRLILEEEVAEAYAESDPEKLREELIQVAGVALQWAAAIDRRGA